MQTKYDRFYSAIVCAAIALFPLTGCQSLKDLRGALPLPQAQATPPKTPAAVKEPSSPKTAEEPDLLADDGWIRPRRRPDDLPSPDELHWRHSRLDAAIAEMPQRRPDFAGALTSTNPVIAANAAIALARLGSGEGLDVLTTTVRSRDLQPRLQYAAAEALGRFTEPSPAPVLRKLLDEYNAAPGKSKIAFDPAMQAELLCAYARHQEPADDPRFTAALDNPAPQVRAAALEAWARARSHTLPATAISLRQDQDSAVRAAALWAITAQRHPTAHEYLSHALRDSDFDVRLAAAKALGELGGQDARITLEGLATDSSERLRSAALLALARMGSSTMLLVAAEDEAWRVRAAAAESLSRLTANRETLTVARALISDSNLQVQKQLVDSLAAWPLEQAGPLLLQAIDEAPFATRQVAAAQLAERWPAAADFRPDAPPEQLATLRADLRGRWAREFGLVERASVPSDAIKMKFATANNSISSDRLDEIQGFVQRVEDPSATPAEAKAAILRLSAVGPDLLPALETIAAGREHPLPDAIYRDILPTHSPEFEAIERLTAKHVAQRQQAAAQLTELAASGGLHPLATRRISEVAIKESDPVVWSRILQAIASDSGESAEHLALVGISHPVAEVRRRACLHLGQRFRDQYVSALVPALADTDATVARAALQALAQAGTLPDIKPITALLNSPHKSLRVEAALTLGRLDSPEGPAALERLAFDPDLDIRRQAAAAMGELADPAFMATLIGLLDDRNDISRAALNSLHQVSGDNQPFKDSPKLETTAQIEQWKRWWNQNGQAR